MSKRVFPNFHRIVSAELAAYFQAKAAAIEAEAKVTESAARLKLLGVDPEWRISEALSAKPEDVICCDHPGCDRPVISHSWDPKSFCEEHHVEKTRPRSEDVPTESEA